MLSRVADAIFWMSRYMERTKVETTLLLTNYTAIQDNAIENNWDLIFDQYGHSKVKVDNQMKIWKSSELLTHLITDKENPSSIANNIIAARENARSVQDNITKELWQTLNNFYHIVKSTENEYKLVNEDPVDVMDNIINQCYLYYGIIDITIARGEGYHFMNIGKYLERAIQTINVLCIKLKEIELNIADDANILSFRYALYALSGYELFGKTYKGAMSCSNMIHHILFNP
ncbi:MAG: alpha-E domain-containing protein, partial [Saprospiraceae bacterium]